MNNTTISRVGTILYALVIGFFGINHFCTHYRYAKHCSFFYSRRVFWVYLTGIALIAAAISFIIGKQTRLAGLLLAAFLLLVVLTVHLPAVMRSSGEAVVSISLLNLVKDTGLAGAALIIAGRGN